MLIYCDIYINVDGWLVVIGYLMFYLMLFWWCKQFDWFIVEYFFLIVVLIIWDGVIFVIEMLVKMVNFGCIYCVVGFLDVYDIVNGKVDFDVNMLWEVMEEIGIDLLSVMFVGGYLGVWVVCVVMLYWIFFLFYDVEEVCVMVCCYMEIDYEQEIVGFVIICDKSWEG